METDSIHSTIPNQTLESSLLLDGNHLECSDYCNTKASE